MKRSMFFIILFVVIFLILMGVAYCFYQYYAPPQQRQSYSFSVNADDTLRIAFIGDSWAYLHNSNNRYLGKLLEDSLHRPVMVFSFGICGKTSKEIYESMFDDTEFKCFLSARRYDYCYVSAGINDTYKKMSTSYYKKSMDGIIRILKTNHIWPILQEIPDYDIQKTYSRQEYKRKLLRQLSMRLNDTPLNCKQSFRDVLDELINEKGYQGKVSVIRYQSWNDHYYDDLKLLYQGDGMHLNDRGYARLDSVIANEIIKLEIRRNGYK